MKGLTIFWFRRDLRLFDNRALYEALKNTGEVLPLFIFDTAILADLDETDARIDFIHEAVSDIHSYLSELNKSMLVISGEPFAVFKRLVSDYPVKSVYFNRDYEPYAKNRDEKITSWLNNKKIEVKTFKDQVIFEPHEILKKDGKPYTVYTPYKNKWKSIYEETQIPEYSIEKYFDRFVSDYSKPLPSLASLGFKKTPVVFPEAKVNKDIVQTYDQYRDYPYMDHTSRMGIHLRFGTISIRDTMKQAVQLNQTWFNQLIWREFFMMILWHFPKVVDCSFKSKYDNIQWRNNEMEFKAWCEGKTGFPFVDAGMRQLNQTGYMHNRARMITASFLTKHLLIDWRWGETYFAQKLLDYELASNNGGWQWAAGTGCDAAPYFRIFNPQRQIERFDPKYQYIQSWVPEYGTSEYPDPIVDHKFARERALSVYKKALNQ